MVTHVWKSHFSVTGKAKSDKNAGEKEKCTIL